ncbi:hypothetical protein Taro_020430 [Colocasia esculenta]|uniref:Uncharacterized protein n=1 Tax=Colocasia esculenta TaxID=4460 RepID=A0A843UNN7_COLES|nr:hypothetical protein [Colocasia esculenta]
MPPTGSAPKPKAQEDVPCNFTHHLFFFSSSSDSFASDDEANDGNADLIAPDEYTPLLGDSLPPHGVECGSTSRAGGNLISEVDFIEPSSHCPLPEAVVTGCVDSTSAYAEYKAFAEQYPFTPIDAYIPGPAEKCPVAEAASSGGQSFCDQLLSWGVMDSNFIVATSSPFFSWDGLGSPFFSSQAYSAFQEFYAEESSSVQPPAPEAETEVGNLPYSNPPPLDFDDGGSPLLGLEVLSEHGVDWPTRARPSPGPEDEDLWNFLVDRVGAVVDSEDPPPIDAVKRVLKEKTTLAFNSGISQKRWMAFVGDIWGEVCRRHGNAVWVPYVQRIQTLEDDLCSSASDADRRGSRITEVRKGRKARKLKITAEMENVIRLQRELEEARSSLEQEVKGDAKDFEEEAALIKDDEEHRRSTSFKTKEAGVALAMTIFTFSPSGRYPGTLVAICLHLSAYAEKSSSGFIFSSMRFVREYSGPTLSWNCSRNLAFTTAKSSASSGSRE